LQRQQYEQTPFQPLSSGVLFSTTAPDSATDSTTTATTELTPEYEAALNKAKESVAAVIGKVKPDLLGPLYHFCTEYMTASQASYLKNKNEAASPQASLRRILEGIQFGYKFGMDPESRYTFGVTHDALRGVDPEKENGNTFDYYSWGCEFFRYFMDPEESKVEGLDNLKRAMDQAGRGENVVFFANHQSEADPQVMSVMLEKAGYKKEAEQVIYVAGHKVTTDPLGKRKCIYLFFNLRNEKRKKKQQKFFFYTTVVCNYYCCRCLATTHQFTHTNFCLGHDSSFRHTMILIKLYHFPWDAT
jgi:glycerol-3-phosphate O-acyltransferase